MGGTCPESPPTTYSLLLHPKNPADTHLTSCLYLFGSGEGNCSHGHPLWTPPQTSHSDSSSLPALHLGRHGGHCRCPVRSDLVLVCKAVHRFHVEEVCRVRVWLSEQGTGEGLLPSGLGPTQFPPNFKERTLKPLMLPRFLLHAIFRTSIFATGRFGTSTWWAFPYILGWEPQAKPASLGSSTRSV